MKLSPLFWPIELKQNAIFILDETLLPHRIKYLKVKDYKGAVKAIKEMKTRAVGQVLLVLYAFILESRKDNTIAHLEKIAEAFNTARPTLSFKILTDMVLGWAKNNKVIEGHVLGFLEGLKHKRIEQAKEASTLFNDGDVVLTHCNVSGLLPLIAEFCKEQNKKISFFVTETRPYLQGARLTAWELQQAGISATIIADNMVAQVMHEGKINKVIVGADHLALNGDIANKIGTYQIAILAKQFNIPFYVLCPPASGAKSGQDIRIEVRPESELLNFCGVCIAPKGAKGYYPAFDVTPDELITKHIYLNL